MRTPSPTQKNPPKTPLPMKTATNPPPLMRKKTQPSNTEASGIPFVPNANPDTKKPYIVPAIPTFRLKMKKSNLLNDNTFRRPTLESINFKPISLINEEAKILIGSETQKPIALKLKQSASTNTLETIGSTFKPHDTSSAFSPFKKHF